MVVSLTMTAEEELWDVWLFNLNRYGLEHADRYLAFLRQGIQTLADEHDHGRPVQGFPDLLSMAFRQNPRGDGHIAIYEVDLFGRTVSVLHVFHTRQDVPGRLRDDH